MADSILKLKVESSEYDAKLKKAAEGIRHLADVAHKGGRELTGLEKAEVEYIRALGEMETKSRTAAGSTRELENAFKELTVIYNNLSDVEKADEGGKALAASLEQIKQRAIDAKAQLDTASRSLQDNGNAAQKDSGILDALASKFTINIDALKLFDYGLQAVNGALSVAKDAFMSSEANVDEWGRTVAASQSVYQSFLNAINTGDISGYLSRIDEIVNAARTAYNELDRLGTMKTIQAPQMSAQQTENERLRMMIQTGRYIAPVDGRRATMKDGQLLTKDQIQNIERMLQNGMKSVVELVGNEVKQAAKAIDAVYNRQAKELGLSLSEFRKGTSSMAEFDKRMEGFSKYQQWRAQHTTIDLQSGREIVARGNPYEQYAKWGTFRVDGDRYAQLVQLIQQRDMQAGQAYSMQSQAYRTMNRAEGITLNKLMGRGGSGETEKKIQTELQQNQTQINKLTDDYVKLGDEATESARKRQEEIQKEIQLLEKRNALLGLRMEQAQGRLLPSAGDFDKNTKNVGGVGMLEQATNFGKNIAVPKGGLQLSDKVMKSVEKSINKQLKNDEKKEKEKDPLQGMSEIVGGIQTMTGALEYLGVEVPEGINKMFGAMQDIITIVSAIQAMQQVGTWLGLFANGGLIGKAAGGMLIPGTSFSGDNLRMPVDGGRGVIGVNSGELILSKSQQYNLASALSGNGLESLNLSAEIRGEQIRLVLNNNGRRTGRGEYVQTNRR